MNIIIIYYKNNNFIKDIVPYIQKYGYTINIIEFDECCLFNLNNYDIVICEWCDKNAVYLSRMQLKGKLWIRLHRYEMFNEHKHRLKLIKWCNVNKLIFISQYMKEYFELNFNYNVNKVVLYNYNKMTIDKNNQDTINKINYGMLGINPINIKNPEIAIDICIKLNKELNKNDSFYIKSKNLVSFDKDINIKYENFDDNVYEWFKHIKFIFSTSYIEGSHQAINEAMYLNTIPILYGNYVNSYGARKLYLNYLCFKEENQIIKFISNITDLDYYRRINKAYIENNFSIEKISNDFINLINDTYFFNIFTLNLYIDTTYDIYYINTFNEFNNTKIPYNQNNLVFSIIFINENVLIYSVDYNIIIPKLLGYDFITIIELENILKLQPFKYNLIKN